MLRLLLSAALLALPLGVLPATAQDLAAYDRAEAAAIAAWDQMPLTARSVTFVTREAEGFGLYDPRASAVFAPSEPLILYAEPMGFGWRGNGDGTWTFGFSIDVVLRDGAGAIVASQPAFQRQELTSRARNREFYLTLTLNMTGAPAGDYALEYIVHDLASDKIGTIARTFSIAAP